LISALDSSARLTLLEALAEAAAEITRELAPGSVELRLRGRDPEFVVTAPAVDVPDELPPVGDEAATARINLRLSDGLKARVEQAAEREGLSINSWLVRAVAAGVERGAAAPVRRSGQTYRGWVR
jgi:HicB-like protein involved in pilus formation